MADPTFAVLFRYAEDHNDARTNGSISTELSLISTEILLLLPTKVLVVTVILVLYFSHIICII
jgi:hypothetical protein